MSQLLVSQKVPNYLRLKLSISILAGQKKKGLDNASCCYWALKKLLVVQFQEKIAKIDTDMYKTFSIRAGSISDGKLKGFSSESVLKRVMLRKIYMAEVL